MTEVGSDGQQFADDSDLGFDDSDFGDRAATTRSCKTARD